KIDRSFVSGMLDDADDRAIVEGVIGLVRAFHREVIAEGVETSAHGELLLKLGCELAQGFDIPPPHDGRRGAWLAGPVAAKMVERAPLHRARHARLKPGLRALAPPSLNTPPPLMCASI